MLPASQSEQGTDEAARNLAAKLRAGWCVLGAETGIRRANVMTTQNLMSGAQAPAGADETATMAGQALSIAQRRIWAMAQIGGEAVLGRQVVGLRLRGALDHKILIRALAFVEQRHEALRLCFVRHAGGRIEQRVQAAGVLPLETIDLRTLPQGQRAAEAARLSHDDDLAQFDLAHGPAARARLLRLGDHEHLLVLAVHAMVGDPASLRHLAHDALAAYAALARGDAPEPPAATAGLMSVVARERAWQQSAASRAALAYWQARLTEDELATFPGEAGTTAAVGGRQEHRRRLGMARCSALRALGRALDAPLPALLLTALHLLLARYGVGKVSRVGAVRSPQPVVGPLQTIVPTQLRPTGETRFADALRAVEAAMEEAGRHLVPFELLAQQQAGDLLPVLLEWRSALPEGPLAGGLVVEPMADAGLRGDADVVVVATECRHGRLELRVGYAAERFGRATIERAAAHLLRILDAAVADPNVALRDIALVGPAELDRLSRPYVHTRPYDPRPVHELIAAQATRRPEATAIIHAARRWSHRELEQRANRVAHRLLQLGLAPEQRVAVALPRSPEAIAAILGVLKAGGAFVPVDSDHPASRNHHILADAGVRIVVTDRHHRRRLPQELPATVLPIDDLELDTLPVSDPGVATAPERLAYVIYTSGSTGLPKGVAVEHGPLTRHLQATAALYEMTEASLELPFLPFSSDGGHERWMVPLMVGGGIVLPDQPLLTPAETFALMRRHGVNNASLPTTYLQQLAEWAARTGDPPPLRLYSFGGEGLPKATFDLLRRALRADWLINGYGPTETVMTPMVWKIRADAAFSGTYAPIGRAVGQRRVYVLDPDLNPVPVGVVGEIHLGGDGVARGYVGRPELTAERFIPDPFAAGNGRLYRSGDLGRWREDGTIEFVGRVDQQVKLRGFRIELGEIEAALAALPGISEAVAVLRRDGGEAALVGYVVPSAGAQRPDGQALRRALGGRLPDYMLPAAIVVLDRLPLNANSKLDRAALPPPVAASDLAAPMAGAEAEIARIWQDVLGLARIGAEQNFFDLGGHSMAALRVLGRLRELYPRSGVSIADLFNHQTVRALAARIAGSGAGGETVHLRREGSRPMLYCFPGLLVSTREYLKLVEHLGPEQPATGFICYSLSDGGRLSTSVEAITARYAEEVRRQSRGRPCAFLGWSWGGLLAYEAARMLGDEVDVRLLGMVDVCDMDADFALDAVPQFAPGEREACERRVAAWLARAAMRVEWERLLGAMDPPAYDQFLHYVARAPDELPTDGPDVTSRERIFWVLIDNALIFRRYRLVPHDRPIHAWAAGDSLHRGLQVIDWRRFSHRAGPAEIVPGTTHFDIIGAPAFHDRFARRLQTAWAAVSAPEEHAA